MNFSGKSSGEKPVLLSIIEIGGYPDFTALYESFGFRVVTTDTVRKAVKLIRQYKPAVMVAEFNFQSDFRDRTSSLESLLAVVQRLPDTQVIVFYEKEFTSQFDKLRVRLPVYQALPFPVDEPALRLLLQGTAVSCSG